MEKKHGGFQKQNFEFLGFLVFWPEIYHLHWGFKDKYESNIDESTIFWIYIYLWIDWYIFYDFDWM